eukprot:1572670-Alexandrium_andersonii.AAC.1
MLRVAPLGLNFSDIPCYDVTGPEAPPERGAATCLRLSIWKEYLKAAEWRAIRDRPVAVALQHLPKETFMEWRKVGTTWCPKARSSA